jgi:ferritin-like protein
MNRIEKFAGFVQMLEAKQYINGKNDVENNKASFYEMAGLKDDQKKAIEKLVDTTASIDNIEKQINYKYLVVAKLAGMEDKDIVELEKAADAKNEDFAPMVLFKLAKLTMEQGKAFAEL